MEWLIGYCVIGLLLAAAISYFEGRSGEDFSGAGFAIGVFWPAVLLFLVVALPYAIGLQIRKTKRPQADKPTPNKG